MYIILHAFSLLVVVQCVTVMNLNYYQRSQVGRPEQITALNAKTKQCITAKISGSALKNRGTEHTQCYVVSAVHNYKNTRLRI